ncbi:MAG: hypothetical protein ABIS86_10130 [Streptosporangiaceae bacterium]
MIVGASGLSDLDLAIDRLSRGPLGPCDPRPRLQLLASAFQIRHRLTGEPADLDRCCRHLAELIDGLAEDHPNRPEAEAWLGRVLMSRAAGRPGLDLDAAVRLLDKTVERFPDDRSVLRDLVRALTLQCAGGDRGALEPLIAVGRRLLGLDPGNGESALALARALAAQRPRSSSDRDEAIALLKAGETPDSDRLVLARLLAGRALDVGGADVEEALDLLGRLVDSPELSVDELGMARRVRCGLRELWGGAPQERHRAALAVTQASDPAYPELVLRVAVDDRAGGRPRDVEGLRRLADRLGPGHPLAGSVLAEVAFALSDLRAVVRTSAEALCLVGRGDPLRAELMLRLADALAELDCPVRLPADVLDMAAGEGLFRGLVLLAGRRTEDDVEALTRLERALAELPTGHRLRPSLLALLGTGLARRADVLGDLEALDAADRHLAEAIRYRPESLRLRVAHSCHRVIMARHRCLPGLVDDSIRALESDLAAVSTTDPWYPKTLWALGEAWWTRGTLLDVPRDRQRGLELVIAAEAALPGGHPDRDRISDAVGRVRTELSPRGRPGASDPAGPG